MPLLKRLLPSFLLLLQSACIQLPEVSEPETPPGENPSPPGDAGVPPDTKPVPDVTPPTLLNTAPVDGSLGIARTASITVTFSEPMDKASAQTAFAIVSPPGFNSGVFDWNEAGTEMTFNPDADFSYGTEINWRLSTGAKDLSSNALAMSMTGVFHVIRTNTVTIDFDLLTSGSASSPNYGVQTHYYNLSTLGDNALNAQYRLLIGFKTDSLPENLTAITHSTLKWHVTGQRGTPFSALGPLLLERVYIGDEIALSTTEETNPASKVQFESAPLGPAVIITDSNPIALRTFDVTSLVNLDWQDRHSRGSKRSQFRFRFESPSNGNNTHDCLQTDASAAPKLAELEISYEYP